MLIRKMELFVAEEQPKTAPGDVGTLGAEIAIPGIANLLPAMTGLYAACLHKDLGERSSSTR